MCAVPRHYGSGGLAGQNEHQPQVPQVSSGGRGGGGAKGVVEVRHLCRDRGGGQEEAGDVVMETHPAAQVRQYSCDLHVTLM